MPLALGLNVVNALALGPAKVPGGLRCRSAPGARVVSRGIQPEPPSLVCVHICQSVCLWAAAVAARPPDAARRLAQYSDARTLRAFAHPLCLAASMLWDDMIHRRAHPRHHPRLPHPTFPHQLAALPRTPAGPARGCARSALRKVGGVDFRQ
jgi:hypothetical protein